MLLNDRLPLRARKMAPREIEGPSERTLAFFRQLLAHEPWPVGNSEHLADGNAVVTVEDFASLVIFDRHLDAVRGDVVVERLEVIIRERR